MLFDQPRRALSLFQGPALRIVIIFDDWVPLCIILQLIKPYQLFLPLAKGHKICNNEMEYLRQTLNIIIIAHYKPVKLSIQMRNNSPSAKKTHDFSKLIQSRTLITSSSINPLSKNITTKLDIIKQEILRQYHQKFPTEKKRTNSVKKINSASKSRAKQQKLSIDPLSRKLNFNRENQSHGINVATSKGSLHTESNLQSKVYRQKFNQIQDRLFQQKQKVIQNYEKNSLLKQNIIQFLEQPNSQTANELKNHFGNQRQYKIIDNFISMREDIDYAENTFGELLSLVEVDSIENLLKQLKNRQNGFKNLSQCSYKIIELQTAYNKLQGQSQQKLKQIINEQNKKQKQLKTQLQSQNVILQHSIEKVRKQEQDNFKRVLNNLLQAISKNYENTFSEGQSLEIDEVCSSRAMYVTFDKNSNRKKLSHEIQMKESKANQERYQFKTIEQFVEQIQQLFQQLQSNIFDIEREAEQNVQKLKASKNDMDRLEKLIQNVTRQTEEEKNKLIQSYEIKLQQQHTLFERVEEKLKEAIFQKQQQFRKLQAELRQQFVKIQQVQANEQKHKKQMSEASEKIIKKQNIITQIIKIVCEATGEDIAIFGFDINEGEGEVHLQIMNSLSQIAVNKIQVILKKHLLLLKQNLQSAQNLILWHQKQLQIKQALLKQFDFNLKKLVEQSEGYHEKQKQLCFERDEYKYLLNNLRQTVKQMKKQYEQKIIKTAEQKDNEYLNSNKDILMQNQRLNSQIQKLQLSILQISNQLKSETASHQFYRRKAEQFQTSIVELRKKLIITQNEAKNYKQCLSDIEISFKQVQSMSQIRSQKMIGLQSENKTISNQINELKVKIQQLNSNIQLKDDSFNKLQYSYEEYFKKCQKLTKIKEDVELQNSNLRIKNIQIMDQCRAKLQQYKKFQYENIVLNKQNKKLMEEVNYLTKKLINYVGDEQKFNRVRKLIKSQYKKLKQQYMFLKNTIKDKLQTQINQIKYQIQQTVKQFISQYYKQVNNMQQLNQKSQIKSNQADKNCHKMKIQLLLNSIRNENNQIKFVINAYKQYTENLIKLYGQQLIQSIKKQKLNREKQIEYKSVEKQLIQQKSECESQDLQDLQDSKQQDVYFMSPQFVRIRKQTYSQENQSAKQQPTKQKQNTKDENQRMMQKNTGNNNITQNHNKKDQLKISNKSNNDSQIQRVKTILNNLKEGENEDPKIPYLNAIHGQYKQLKRKLQNKHLNLDISAVSFKPQTVSSPSSVSFSKQFAFDKRCNTEPNQDLGSIAPRQTNRSQNKNDRSILSLKKQNQAYKQQIEKLQEILKTVQDRQELLKIQLSQLEKKNVELQNESSKQTKDKLFNKFITQIFNQNWKDAKVSCRTLLKLIGLTRETINEKLQEFDNFVNRNGKKKVSNGAISGLFNNQNAKA